mmetsp:Transcript_18880/g.47910  ORF Transcript_18880/g.47910 Transcript_18880/m.47910 type:complete len:227 (-) Transcript_18880:184-864(-)
MPGSVPYCTAPRPPATYCFRSSTALCSMLGALSSPIAKVAMLCTTSMSGRALNGTAPLRLSAPSSVRLLWTSSGRWMGEKVLSMSKVVLIKTCMPMVVVISWPALGRGSAISLANAAAALWYPATGTSSARLEAVSCDCRLACVEAGTGMRRPVQSLKRALSCCASLGRAVRGGTPASICGTNVPDMSAAADPPACIPVCALVAPGWGCAASGALFARLRYATIAL